MKQLSVADELFDTMKQVRKIFSNDMAVYSSGGIIENTPVDYIAILQKLYQAAKLIDLDIDNIEQNISFLYDLSSKLRTKEVIFSSTI